MVDWEQHPLPAESPNTYMKVLIKETLTLHKVLSKYLASQAVEVSSRGLFAESEFETPRVLCNLIWNSLIDIFFVVLSPHQLPI